jgi:hypothetical protein
VSQPNDLFDDRKLNLPLSFKIGIHKGYLKKNLKYRAAIMRNQEGSLSRHGEKIGCASRVSDNRIKGSSNRRKRDVNF